MQTKDLQLKRALHNVLFILLLCLVGMTKSLAQKPQQIKVSEINLSNIGTIEERVFMVHSILDKGYFCYKNLNLTNTIDIYVSSDASDELSDFDFFYDNLLYDQLNEFSSLDKNMRGELFVQWRQGIDDEVFRTLYEDFTRGIASENATCETASPFTANGAYSFYAGVYSGSPCGSLYNVICSNPYYCNGSSHQGQDNCLYTAPNPAFYYIRITSPGDLNIYMESTPSKDIDFDCWGPFDDISTACGQLSCSNIVDCSYSAAPTENCHIYNAQVGEYYILLITNYSNSPCEISFENVGTGSGGDILITATASPDEGGIVSGADFYNSGETCTLTATSNEGYTFLRWTKNGTIVSTNSIYSFTVTESEDYVADFNLNNYQITVTANPTNSGTVTGGGTFNYGQSCTLTATAADGYTFVRWTENGNQVSTEANYTFTVTENRTLVANFAEQEPNTYNINVSATPSNGGMVTGDGTYNQGASCTVTATANTGYIFLFWTENGNQISTNANYTFNVTGNRTLVAQFQMEDYTINASANPTNGGTVTGDGIYNYGQYCTLTATSTNGYTFVRWTENGNQVSTNANYTFTVTGNRTLVANFAVQAPNTYNINVSANPSIGGVVTGGGSYNQGASCMVRAAANSGYTFLRWTENGSQVSTNANYIFNVTDNRTLVAQFQIQSYTINASANPMNGGTVTGDGIFNYGQSCTLTATAANGYTFVRWTENGSQVSTNANYTFSVTRNRTLVANFTVQAPNTYTINVSANPSISGMVTGGGSYNQGASCTLTATANAGYTFSHWMENGNQISSNMNYSFTVTGNRTLVANFTDSSQPPMGIINGLFSVSDSQQVYFSQGNLQYIGSASTPYWKFADNQWDVLGTTTGQNSSDQDVDRDLFGWGTSGFNHGANCYLPWSTNGVHTDYYIYGCETCNLNDQTGQADWGYNAISNGGGQENQWRTLTNDEWNYVFNTRSTTSGIRYAKATVNGVNGVILLPNNWSSSIYILSNTNDNGANYNSNILTISQWRILEQNGAVFLPATGRRGGTNIYETDRGSYWSATHQGDWGVYQLNFNNSGLNPRGINARDNGISVRLVRPVQDNGTYTINATSSPTQGGTIIGAGIYNEGEICTLTATANEGYIFVNWTENGNVVSSNSTLSFMVSCNRTLVANFQQGAINGKFTINSSGGQVYFSQGNLQYQASTNTWKFAENQWDCLRLDNANISTSYDGWIDLFGWGTSGYDHGAVCYQPWSTSTNGNDYYAYGSSTYNLYDQTGRADWGYNAISNGGNTENQWRTLTSDEWSYLLLYRNTPSGIRFAKAIVNDIEGLVVLPDNWDSSIYGLNDTDNTSANYSTNIISENDWTSALEPHGVLFLPAGSYRRGSSYIEHSNPYKAYYWASSKDRYIEFNNSQLFVGSRSRNNGLSVRLVKPVQDNGTYTINTTTTPTEGGTVTGAGTYNAGATCILTATTNEGYIFVNWTENGNVVSSNSTLSFTVSCDRNLVANFGQAMIHNHWIPKSASYSEVMTMNCVIQIDGVEQYSDMLEVGVFCGDECRGSAIAAELPIMSRYLAILTVYGEVGHQLTFKLYDHSIGQELNLTSPPAVTFTENGYGTPIDPYILNFTSAETITATVDPIGAGTVTGTGNYAIGTTCTLTAMANSDYQFLNWTLNGVVVSTNTSYQFTVTGSAAYVAHFQHCQNQNLAYGWSWWSTYIEQEGIDGLGMLENSIGSAGIRIQGRTGNADQFEYQGTSYWYGTLDAIENEQMYKIRTNAACNVVIIGDEAHLADHPITINSGWNWIGFPSGQSISLDMAMSGFTPEANDVIKGRNGIATYVSYGNNHLWYGTLTLLEPGQGYMYKSNSSTAKTLTFQSGREEKNVTNVKYENSFFTPNVADFSSNMLVTAVIEMDGQELRSEDYELAAFVGNECRGSVKLMYVEPLDRYIGFLLVFGEEEEEIHFVLTDGNDVVGSDDFLTYVIDGIEGTVTEPTILYFGTLGVNDSERDIVNIFPNPSDGVFNIEGNGIRKIEVFDVYGQVIFSKEVENNSMQIDLSGKAMGMYLLRVITNNGITTNQLIIK